MYLLILSNSLDWRVTACLFTRSFLKDRSSIELKQDFNFLFLYNFSIFLLKFNHADIPVKYLSQSTTSYFHISASFLDMKKQQSRKEFLWGQSMLCSVLFLFLMKIIQAEIGSQ